MKPRIRELRKLHKLSLRELGEKLNISFSQLAKIERGESLANSQQILLFADFFNVSTDYLLGLPIKQSNYEENRIFKSVQVLNYENIQEDNFAVNSKLGHISAKVNNPEHYFYIKINDDSMSPTFIKDDYVLVKIEKVATNNDIVAAVVEGQGVRVNRYRIIGDDKFLFPDNDEYDPLKIEPEDNPYIVGVVEGFFRPKIKKNKRD